MILDHFYLWVDDPVGAEQLLADFGIHFTLHATHPGQGTRNACAFFQNAYCELLMCTDEALLQSPVVQPLCLWERLHWRRSGASPFGVAFRGQHSSGLETWPYPAPFLPAGEHLPIVTPPGRPELPMIFLIPPHLPIRLQSATTHCGAPRTVTRLNIYGPQLANELPPVDDALSLHSATEHHLDLEWGHGTDGQSRNFSPALPLTIRW